MLKLLSTLVTPSGFAYLLFFVGLLAALWARTRRTSWWLLCASGAIQWVFSTGMVAAVLMSPLDYAYPVVRHPEQFPDARHIVVLTGWAAEDADMPLTGQLGASTAYRVLLALEMYKDRPDCDVIVSGDPDTARIMGEALVKLGLAPTRLRLENSSFTTAESAANLPAFVGKDTFFLVTSAGHLPRSMAAFERMGLNAVPAPTDHQLSKDWRRAEALPSPASLVVSDLAAHEYVGMLWYRLRGRI